jgi:UDP-glucose 4-epimerase
VLFGTDRVLITGGAGVIGSHIADLLVKHCNPEIIILDNFSQGRRENLRWALSHGRLDVIEGDIRDAALVHEVMNGVGVVFHQAEVRHAQSAEDPRLALEVMADGTFNVLEAGALNRVRKVIAASSACVYGLADSFPTPESHHCYNNRTLYGAAKLFNEALMRSFYEMYGLNYVALRYFNIYGPRVDIQGGYTDTLVRWMDRLSQRQPCVILGDGSQTLDLIYTEDIARAAILAAMSSVTDEVFNIGSGVETSLYELAATLGRVMGSRVAPEFASLKKAEGVARRLADTSKADKILGFKAQVPLEEGLGRLVSWWERQRAFQAAIA